MRKLNRSINPATFPIQFTGNQRVQWELELLKEFRRVRRNEIEKISFTGKSSRWKNAKDNLLLESDNKCAYCECYFRTVAYGDVEHYRPKSKYWWLAFSYHNYSASCQLCNQKYKKAKFPNANGNYKAPIVRKNSTNTYLARKAGSFTVDPLDDNSGLTLQDFINTHINERPLSIDPYIDDPSLYFSYKHNDQTREVEICELSQNVESIAKSTIQLFGLNRKELRDLRYRGFIKYRLNRQVAESSNDPNFKQAAINLLNQEYYDQRVEFNGMYNYYKTLPLIPL